MEPPSLAQAKPRVAWVVRRLRRAAQRLSARLARRAPLLKAFARERVHHQVKTSTRADRYPLLFDSAQRSLGQHSPLRILSFGCSSGEECVALATRFPRAMIIGADIDDRALSAARKKNARDNIVYIRSEPRLLTQHGPFDLILALSVLCRWPELRDAEDSSAIYPFAVFEAGVEQLDALLRSAGVLVIHNASYRFMDTQIARSYIAEEGWQAESEIVKKFSSKNRALPEEPPGPQAFRRVASRAP